MNPFLLDATSRLHDWKEFRNSLSEMSEDDQLTAVAKYWAQAPLLKLAYDIEQAHTLPSPWEMISEGNWCRNSVAVGMDFTLRLAGWSKDRLRLSLIRDWDLSEIILVVIIDGTKVLNYNHAVVSGIPETKHDVVGQWHFSGKLYSQVI